MTNGQLVTELDTDYGWDFESRASSCTAPSKSDPYGIGHRLTLEDSRTEQVQPISGTPTSQAEETVPPETLRMFDNHLRNFQFASETGATSPYFLSLRVSGSRPSLEMPLALALLRYGLDRDDGDRLAERLTELKIDLAEEEDLPDLSMSSVSGLIRFLGDNPQLRDPGLVANNAGNIRAEWHRSWSQHFVVEFISDTEAQFVVFVADAQEKSKVARIWVICTVASLMEYAAPHGVEAWAMRA